MVKRLLITIVVMTASILAATDCGARTRKITLVKTDSTVYMQCGRMYTLNIGCDTVFMKKISDIHELLTLKNSKTRYVKILDNDKKGYEFYLTRDRKDRYMPSLMFRSVLKENNRFFKIKKKEMEMIKALIPIMDNETSIIITDNRNKEI